jgi:hypothetical protein
VKPLEPVFRIDELVTLNEFTANDGDRRWIALAQNGVPTRVRDLHAVTAVREAGGAGMRRTAIDINVFLVIKDTDGSSKKTRDLLNDHDPD